MVEDSIFEGIADAIAAVFGGVSIGAFADSKNDKVLRLIEVRVSVIDFYIKCVTNVTFTILQMLSGGKGYVDLTDLSLFYLDGEWTTKHH